MKSLIDYDIQESPEEKPCSCEESKHTAVAELTTHMLSLLGEDPNREGLLETPERHAKAMSFLTSGYQVDTDELVGNAIFNFG